MDCRVTDSTLQLYVGKPLQKLRENFPSYTIRILESYQPTTSVYRFHRINVVLKHRENYAYTCKDSSEKEIEDIWLS